MAITAIAAGAEIVEKHIALDGQKNGLDIKFSLKGKKIKEFKNDIKIAYDLLGKKQFYRNKSEEKSKLFKRSIFIVKNIKKGEKFSTENIKRIRPGHGLEPKYYERILGKKSPKNLSKGNPLRMTYLKKIFV